MVFLFIVFVLVAFVACIMALFTQLDKVEAAKRKETEYRKSLFEFREWYEKMTRRRGDFIQFGSTYFVRAFHIVDTLSVVRQDPNPFDIRYPQGVVIIHDTHSNRVAELPYRFKNIEDKDLITLVHLPFVEQ